MPEPPTDTTPTYQESDQGGVTHYTCLVQDASRPGGVCSHDATDFELFTMHMEQRHAGIMIAAPAPGTVVGTPARSPAVPIAADIVQPVTEESEAEPTTQEPEEGAADVPADPTPPPPGDEEPA